MPTLFLHFGYTKTGTTFLQKEIFPKIPETHYLDKPNIDLIPQELPGDGIFRRLFAASPEIWPVHGNEILTSLGIDNLEHVLVSDESVFEMTQTYQLIAAHLAALVRHYCGGIKIILTIRRQDKKLASLYAERSSKVKGACQHHFEQWIRYLVSTVYGYYGEGLRGIMMDYKLMHATLSSVLPSASILMLPYEMMKQNLMSFSEELLSFISIDMDPATLVEKAKQGGKI